jgi:MULE transposase domain
MYFSGIWRGQLAAASGIDGHNWLYPVAFGVFDVETKENWQWFMTQLRNAIGNPPGLAISSNADKGLAHAIASTFPDSEHRECMRHLMENFKKKFHGIIYDKNMWPAAKAYTTQKCQSYLDNITAESPQAIEYLKNHHSNIWCKSKFSELMKCDYLTNNIAECFNSWIKDLKELHLVDLVDQIRHRIMVKFRERKMVGERLNGVILPSVMRDLNVKSKNIGKINVSRGGDNYAEVSGMDPGGVAWRYAVHLNK